MLNRAIHALYAMLTGSALAFAVSGFFLFTGLFAGAATAEALCVNEGAGAPLSLLVCVAVFSMIILFMASPFFAPLTLACAAFEGFIIGYRLPLLAVEDVLGIPSALLGGLGSVLAAAAVCAACAVSIGASFRWAKGVRIPPGERLGRLMSQIGVILFFAAVYIIGAILAGFSF